MRKTIRLRGGAVMPAVGLGTWKSAPGQVGAAVREALRCGYRHIDCAAIYGNEVEIGEALAACFAEGLVAREELWITSKLWNDHHARRDVVPALRRTLADLRLEALDLYLVHWPVALRKGVLVPESPEDMIGLETLPIAETWAGMEEALDLGLSRHIGVSNFSATKLAELSVSAHVLPALDQVELHPYLQQQELLRFCSERGIAVTGYSPLGSPDRPASLKSADEPPLLEAPEIEEIARQSGATAAQVLLAWGLARGTAVIPKSVHPEHLQQNLAAADLALSPADMQRIAALDRGYRYVTGSFWVLEGGPYTLANLWDSAGENEGQTVRSPP